jgi:hypothetical protein
MEVFVNWLKPLRKMAQTVGPYLLLEILMPGGTLCAVLLYVWQRRNPQAAMRARRVVDDRVRASAGAAAPRRWVPAPARGAARLPGAHSIGRR